MNESSSQLEKILTADFDIVKRSQKKCTLKYLLTYLKCKKEKDKDKSYYIKKWRKFLTRESSSKTAMNDPFTILTNLWAHKSVIKELEKVRINPNLITNSTKQSIIIRNDLEFYIPQLCSFILFGEFELVEESVSFLCKACFASFYFAHRVIWFLKSMLSPSNKNLSFNKKIRNILQVIQTIYKSDDFESKSVVKNLYISGSDYYLNLINSNEELSIPKINIFKRYSYCTNSEDEITNFMNQIDGTDINLTSFLSTINFFDHLASISERIRYIEEQSEREKELFKEIAKINEELPLNIYLPFSNSKMRNFLIGNFSIPNCKVFKTKERSPFLLTAECFRLEEICFDKDKGTILENMKSSEMERLGLYTKADSDLKSHFNKISYFLGLDISISKPVYVNKEKNMEINSKEKTNGDNICHMEEGFKKIEMVVKENTLGTTEKLDEVDGIKGEDFVGVNGNFKRKSSINSINSEVSSSDNESEIGDSPTKANENNLINSGNELSSVFGENLKEKEERLRKQSKYGYLSSYRICCFIIKSGEDLRQEQFSSQIINEFAQIFKIEKVDCYLYPYEIISTGYNSGIVEVIQNAISIDELKQKCAYKNYTLKDFYENYFTKGSRRYKKAIKNLIQSLAGYSLICYFLQLKDRHNGNILIDNEGHLIHIDFGFFLSHAPGHEFETAPFKLTNEIIDIFGGTNSKNFQKFRKLLWKGMIAISKHYEKILVLVEMMFCGYGKNLDCFEKGEETLSSLRERFVPKKGMKKKDYIELVDNLIQQALSSWRTKWYDKYQYYFQGIFY